MLRVLQLPASGGGDTAIASMTAAFDALSPSLQELCEGLSAAHDVSRSIRRAIARGHSAADLSEVQKQLPPVEHPVVTVHPETDRRVLFVSVNSTDHIVGTSSAESRMLLDFLFEHVKQPEFQVRVRWDESSLVFHDNRSVQHYAVADYGQRRVLHRVAIQGGRPVGAASRSGGSRPRSPAPRRI